MEGKYSIPIEDICKQYPFDLFDFKDTSGLEPLTGIIGQKRAIEAIDFGLNMKGPGYHIFVTGVGGTGKSSIVRELLDGHAAGDETSQDLCLVNNFENEYCPVAIEMPAGSAVYFSESMARFVEVIKTRISRRPNSSQSDAIWRKGQLLVSQRGLALIFIPISR